MTVWQSMAKIASVVVTCRLRNRFLQKGNDFDKASANSRCETSISGSDRGSGTLFEQSPLMRKGRSLRCRRPVYHGTLTHRPLVLIQITPLQYHARPPSVRLTRLPSNLKVYLAPKRCVIDSAGEPRPRPMPGRVSHPMPGCPRHRDWKRRLRP